MSTYEVLERFGAWGLLRFVAAVALFLVLHAVRVPFVLVARALEIGMGRVDAYVIAGVTGEQTSKEAKS